MSAAKKGIIGSIIGAVCMVCIFIFSGQASMSTIWSILLMIPVGAIFGFGYAFGLRYAKIWISKIFGVAATGSLLAILFSRDRRYGFLIAFLIMTFVLSCTVGFAYIPGIVSGIKQIIVERRSIA